MYLKMFPRIFLMRDVETLSYEFSVELQFEFEWLERAINCSKWAISLQVGMRRRERRIKFQSEV